MSLVRTLLLRNSKVCSVQKDSWWAVVVKSFGALQAKCMASPCSISPSDRKKSQISTVRLAQVGDIIRLFDGEGLLISATASYANRLGQGALSAPDVNPVGGYVCARLELSPIAYSKLIFAYDPKNCNKEAGICFDSGPNRLNGWLQRGTRLVPFA